MLEGKLGASDGPSRGTALSPVRAEQMRDKRVRLSRSVENALDDDIADDGDDDDNGGVYEASPRSISRAVERERFLKIGNHRLEKGTRFVRALRRSEVLRSS